jgi:hypothetical protein
MSDQSTFPEPQNLSDAEIMAMQRRGYEYVEALRVQDLRGLSRENWLRTLRTVHAVREPNVDLFLAALELQRSLLEDGLTFCFIGGIALQRWGEVRQTNDIDLTVLCELGDELHVVQKLRRYLVPRDDRVEFTARAGRMFVGRTRDHVQVDISLGCIEYERRLMDRSTAVDFGIDEPLQCCSAEDLMILKTVAGRGQDWVDLKRITQRSGRTMDWDLVFEELRPLLAIIHKEEALPRLRDLVAREREIRPPRL